MNGRSALTKLAAECHRAKWQFDLSEDYRPSAKAARALIEKAFDELHRIGDLAMKMRESVPVSRPTRDTQASEVTSHDCHTTQGE